MIRIVLFFLFFFTFLQAEFSQASIKYSVYTKSLIQREEEIAKAYEEYLLKELEVPSIEKLIKKEYLLENFSRKNILGINLGIVQNTTLRLDYALNQKNKRFLHKIYQNSLFRERTRSVQDKYILITLQSQESKNIISILQTGIEKILPCEINNNLTNSFCNVNTRSLRFYAQDNNWIEYNKKEFKNGNSIIKSSYILDNLALFPSIKAHLDTQKVGSFIFVKNSNKYIKLQNNIIKRVK